MKVGKQIKMLRVARNMTIKQLADETEMSVGFISNVERDVNSPTVTALQKICVALGVDISSFFDMMSQNSIVFRSSERQRIEMPQESGVISELIPLKDARLIPTYLTLDPGGCYGDAQTFHKGDEICMVLEGAVKVRVGAETYELYEGDCVYIYPMTPHQIMNTSSEPARTFAVTLRGEKVL